MRMRNWLRCSVAGVAVAASVGGADTLVAMQSPGASGGSGALAPLPQGRLLDLKDGDTILLDEGERVRILQRRPANVRATFNPVERWVILVVDFAPAKGDAPDGRPDWTYRFQEVSGNWPLGERWEGEAVVEEYWLAGHGGSHGTGLRTAQGLVQFIAPPERGLFRDPGAAVLTYQGAGRSSVGNVSFDVAEQRAIADTTRRMEMSARGPGAMSSTSVSSLLVGGGQDASVTAGVHMEATPGAVRVGRGVSSPRKIHDVPPVLPEIARQAGVRGMVILDLTIGPDGSVTDARVLRSIPLLDAAALEAARQWRYEPVLLNGQPVTVVMTAAVAF